MRAMTRWLSLATLYLAIGCGGDSAPFEPSVENVSGSYSATTLTATQGSNTIDLLALGATLKVTLATDGSVTGHLFAPGAAEDGSDLDLDLSGSWTLSGSSVTFDMPEDTFVRDVTFTAGPGRLTGERTFGDQTIRAVLTKGAA